MGQPLSALFLLSPVNLPKRDRMEIVNCLYLLRLHERLFACSTFDELGEIVRECQRCRDADGQGEEDEDKYEDGTGTNGVRDATSTAGLIASDTSGFIADATRALIATAPSNDNVDASRDPGGILGVSNVVGNQDIAEPRERLTGGCAPSFRKPRKRMRL